MGGGPGGNSPGGGSPGSPGSGTPGGCFPTGGSSGGSSQTPGGISAGGIGAGIGGAAGGVIGGAVGGAIGAAIGSAVGGQLGGAAGGMLGDGCWGGGAGDLGGMASGALNSLASAAMGQLLAVKDSDPMALAIGKHLASQFGADIKAAIDNPDEFMKKMDLLFNGVKSSASIAFARGDDSGSSVQFEKAGEPHKYAVRRTDPTLIPSEADKGIVVEGNPTILIGGLEAAGFGHGVLGEKCIAEVELVHPDVLMGSKTVTVIPEEEPSEAPADSTSGPAASGGGDAGDAGGESPSSSGSKPSGSQGDAGCDPSAENQQQDESASIEADGREESGSSPVEQPGEPNSAGHPKPAPSAEQRDRVGQIRREISSIDFDNEQNARLRDFGSITEGEYRAATEANRQRLDALFAEHRELEQSYDWPDTDERQGGGGPAAVPPPPAQPKEKREPPAEVGLESPLLDPLDLLMIGAAAARGALIAGRWAAGRLATAARGIAKKAAPAVESRLARLLKKLKDQRGSFDPRLTKAGLAKKAKKLGFEKRIPPQKAPFNSHGQPVYTDGNRYITRDVDRHSGGTWKMFDRRGNRIGTYDENLNYIGP